MFHIPSNLFHLSKHNPIKTHLHEMGVEKWWLVKENLKKECSLQHIMCSFLKKKLAFFFNISK